MRKYFLPSLLPSRYYTSQEREKVETGDLQLVVRETTAARKHDDEKKNTYYIVFVALTENYSTSKLLTFSPEKKNHVF